MTSGKAANCLGYARSLLINKREMHIGSDIDNAFYIAIKMLEQQPCEDAISRSEAIRVASGYCHWTNIPAELAKLPSVNPEPCEDAISRQAVDDAIYDYSRACDVNYAQIMEYIDKLPSVSTEKTDVLDKIIAEIDTCRETLKVMADDDWCAGKIRGYDCAIEIIYKYKAESEE